ncbi:MAG TPA: glycoside hydrolase family 5 protein, partial [Bacilli bacterium]|nr:glycoside hydrolase family 5 protein [Bacilli bacterium]
MRNIWLIFITVILLLLTGCAKQENKETAESLAQWAIKEIEVKDNHINLADSYPGLDVTFTWSIDQPDRIDFTKNILVPTSVEVTVLLTVTVNYQGENVSESASIVIEALELGEEPGEEPVEEPVEEPNEEPDVDPDVFNEADEIAIEFISQISRFIRQDYYIATEFPDFGGSSVTWESSHPEYFSHEGKYTAPFVDVVITISYTVTTTTPALTKSFSKEFTVYKMNNFERNNFIKKYLQDNLTSNGLLKLTDILPTSIGVLGVTLSWYDANKTLVTSLNDVTTYIIPNVGVDLRLKVVTSDYQFELPIRYQTLESNLQAVMRTITSVDLVKEMKVGWNLGNTFDSPSETGWGNPQTTKAMIDAVKAAGFNVLRFPVTWEGHFTEGGDYLIDEDWINRVQELINYAIDKNTFVIINMHHERWNSTSYLNQDRASLIMEKLWLQIGIRFAAYDEHLIFEGMNEPRIYEASDSIQWGGNAEAFAVINHLNQVFVSTIRSLGGNNQYRHLMVTGNGGG